MNSAKNKTGHEGHLIKFRGEIIILRQQKPPKFVPPENVTHYTGDSSAVTMTMQRM